MLTRSDHELALVEKARQFMPAGGLGNTSSDLIIRSGKGSRVWDESGNEYIDYLIGSGPMLAGHAHPRVNEAVQKQIELGSTFFANNRYAIELAEAIVDAVPCAEQVRFVSSGTEADAYAMRLARGHRGRDKILKFEGGYHGMSDTSLQSLAPKRLTNFPRPVADSAGIPAGVGDEVLVAPYNDLDAVANLIAEHRDEIAGVIVEPVQRIIPPVKGFLEGLREITAKHDIVLIFDEVVTGFRMAYGGAQEYYGITPDLCTLGKACGGGYPLAAIAGREEVMAHFDASRVGQEQFLFQIGTLSGNPIAAVAGLATLEVLREPGTYERLNATGNRLMEGFGERLREHGFTATVLGVPACFEAVFAPGPIIDYRGTLRGDASLGRRLNELLLERGIVKGETKYYLSIAHDDEDVRQTFDAWSDALGVLAAERARRS